MYWYLSFLRPPPVSAPVGGQVTITPQVANDLRTELRYETTHISYAWQRVFPGPEETSSALEYLTEFTPPASTYRPLTIPVPPEAKIGESWRLGLFAQNPDIPSESTPSPSPLLDLIRDDPSPGVIGVWSTPIEVCRPQGSSSGGGGSSSSSAGGTTKTVGGKSGKAARGAGADDALSVKKGKGRDKGKEAKDAEAPKQSRINREWTMGEGVSLKIIEQTSFDLDKKVWDSGLALSAWLVHRLGSGRDKGEDGLVSSIFATLGRPDFRAVELGSGTGLVSLALALALNALRARQDPPPPSVPQIVTTDLESAIPLMEENLSLNGLTRLSGIIGDVIRQRVLPVATVLDWEQPLPDWIGQSPGSEAEGDVASWPDLIIAADVTYNTSSFPFLLSTLRALLLPSRRESRRREGRDSSPTLLLAYKQRDLAERELWQMLDKEGIAMRKVDIIQGSEDYGEVEIWVGCRRQS